jgi:hypothetical protein
MMGGPEILNGVCSVFCLSTGPKVRELAALLAVPGTAIAVGVTAVTFLGTAIGIVFIHQQVAIVVHAVGAARFREDILWAAVHRAVARALSRIASAIAAAVRGGLRVVADPRVRIAPGIRAIHICAAAEPIARVAFLLATTVGGARQTVFAVARLADSITARLRTIVADTIVRTTVAVFT